MVISKIKISELNSISKFEKGEYVIIEYKRGKPYIHIYNINRTVQIEFSKFLAQI